MGKSKWQTFTVTQILSRDIYTGDMVQGKSKTMNHKQVAVDKKDWISGLSFDRPAFSWLEYDVQTSCVKFWIIMSGKAASPIRKISSKAFPVRYQNENETCAALCLDGSPIWKKDTTHLRKKPRKGFVGTLWRT